MKLDKILKQLDTDTVKEMEAMDEAQVKTTIATAEEAIAKTIRERDANPQYQAAKQAVKDLSEGLKEVKKRQHAKIQFGLRCLRSLAGEDVGSEE